MARILIKHSTGSKANRIEQFSIDSLEEISLGRDPGATITYDPQEEDLVSRRHALIRVHKGEELSFTIEDRNSSNGTIVNGQRISAERELLPGDEVELGAGGPKFTFDVEPRPPHLVARTRMMTRGEDGPEPPREAATAGVTANGPAPYKVGVGRSTVLDMVSDQLRSQLRRANRTWMYALAGVLALFAIIAGLYAWLTAAKIQETQRNIGITKKEILAKTGEMNSDEIAQRYQDAVVKINLTWRLYYRETGKQIFHKFFDGRPAYVRLRNGQIVRWLVTDDELEKNLPISDILSGTGFVVNERGFILTNKHIAAGWQTFYELQSYEQCNACARLYFEIDANKPPPKRLPYDPITPTDYRELNDWMPGYEGCLFEREKPRRIRCADEEKTPEKTPFEGRNEFLEVRFPEKAASVQANEVDLALIKVDVPDSLKTKVDVADREFAPHVGADVTVMGYPEASEQTLAELYPIEAGKPHERKLEIPEPTVIGGNIEHRPRDDTQIPR